MIMGDVTERPRAKTLTQFLSTVESEASLDVVVEELAQCSEALNRSALGPLLAGDWLGHALHPALTDLPIGFWTSASVIDLLSGHAGRSMARHLVALGVMSALPTLLAGLSEYSRLDSTEDRRVGAVHGLGNAVAIACYISSWRDRRRGRDLQGIGWSVVGDSVATFTGYLGGHLAFEGQLTSADGPERSAPEGSGPARSGPARSRPEGSGPALSGGAPSGPAWPGPGPADA